MKLHLGQTMGFNSLRFIDDFDRTDGCEVHDRLKCQFELPFRGTPQMTESLGQGVQAASLFLDVEHHRRAERSGLSGELLHEHGLWRN